MRDDLIQMIVNRAVDIATSSAMRGQPVKLTWIPPQSTTSDPRGNFAIEYRTLSATEQL